MATEIKNTEIEVSCEQDNDRMVENIANSNEKWRAAREYNRQRQKEEQRQARLQALGRQTLWCIADVLIFIALFGALKAGLMASVLVAPATHLCAIHFGWCANKVICLSRKVRGSK